MTGNVSSPVLGDLPAALVRCMTGVQARCLRVLYDPPRAWLRACASRTSAPVSLLQSVHRRCSIESNPIVTLGSQVSIQIGNLSASLGDRLWATWFSTAAQYARATQPLAVCRLNVQV